MGAEGGVMNKRGGKKANRGPKPKMTKEERRKKYTDIARKRRDKLNGIRRRNNMVCYNCRQPGHNASECPQLGDANQAICTPASNNGTVLCYKCGSTEHALHKCPKRHRGDRNDLPFATCFICNQKGHLASACSQNASGIYVNGGSCRKCGSTQHLATHCPLKKKNQQPKEDANDKKEDDLLQDLVETNPSSTLSKTKQDTQKKKKSESSEKPKKKKKRVVNF